MARPQQPYLFEIGESVKTKYSNFVIEKRMRIKRESSDIRDKKYMCRCSLCGESQEILESTLKNGIGSCRACSDKYSYPAKFFYWFLKQTGIEFDTEYSPKWLGRYRFDFYFRRNSKEYIVEIDGSQHYTHGHKRLTIDEAKAIDRKKENLAFEHGIIVIRLECLESKGKVIESEIKEKLSDLFDMSLIDWRVCAYRAISNKFRLFCDLWNDGHRSTSEISAIVGNEANYISKCLQECSFYGLCDYDPKEAHHEAVITSRNGKKVYCKNNGCLYDSTIQCADTLTKETGHYFSDKGIAKVCRDERKQYKGYIFEYV